MKILLAVGLAILCSAGFALVVVALWLALSAACLFVRWALNLEE